MRQVRKLIEEVFTFCEADLEGISYDLWEQAYRAGEEIGISKKELDIMAGVESAEE
jgi:hypothetical protein